MRVAVASSNGVDVDLHFGHAESFYIYDQPGLSENLFWNMVEIRRTEKFCAPHSNHGKNNGVMQRFVTLLSDCEILLCESIGYHVAQELSARGIRPFMVECDIATGLAACSDGLLEMVSIE